MFDSGIVTRHCTCYLSEAELQQFMHFLSGLEIVYVIYQMLNHNRNKIHKKFGLLYILSI